MHIAKVFDDMNNWITKNNDGYTLYKILCQQSWLLLTHRLWNPWKPLKVPDKSLKGLRISSISKQFLVISNILWKPPIKNLKFGLIADRIFSCNFTFLMQSPRYTSKSSNLYELDNDRKTTCLGRFAKRY